MIMNNSDMKPQKSRLLSLFGILGCGTLLFCLVACVSAYFIFVRDANGEPANTDTIQKVTQEFVVALHDSQFDAAQKMFSNNVRPQISTSDLESLAKEKPISTFQNLRVCEFQVNFGSAGKQIIGYGLLHYGDGVIVFESTLLRDTDNVWRIYSFLLQPNISTTPSGACKID